LFFCLYCNAFFFTCQVTFPKIFQKFSLTLQFCFKEAFLNKVRVYLLLLIFLLF
jgi:hypothetical protein